MPAILTLDANYQPHMWISVQDAMILEAKQLVTTHFGQDMYIYRGGHNKDGIQSTLKTSSIILLDGAPNPRRYREPALTNQALFARDRNTCAYCGRGFRMADLTRDHIHPQSKGGKDKWTNCVTACKGCNNLKDDLMPGEKLSGNLYSPMGTKTMDPLFVPYVPCKAEAMILKSRSIRADQMEFLASKIVNSHSRVLKDWKEGRYYTED